MNACFGKNFRLRSKTDFAYLREDSFLKKGYFLRVYYKKSRVGTLSRIGLSVSKRVGKAHIRNRTKRVLKDIFRQSVVLKKSGIDFLVIVSRELYTSFETRELAEKELRKSFKKLIRKLAEEKL